MRVCEQLKAGGMGCIISQTLLPRNSWCLLGVARARGCLLRVVCASAVLAQRGLSPSLHPALIVF